MGSCVSAILCLDKRRVVDEDSVDGTETFTWSPEGNLKALERNLVQYRSKHHLTNENRFSVL